MLSVLLQLDGFGERGTFPAPAVTAGSRDRLRLAPTRSCVLPTRSSAFVAYRPAALRSQIARTVQRVPEVMVKIPNRKGARNGMGAIRAHLDYISRNGQVELEDQDGNLISGRLEVRDLVRMWRNAGRGIAETSTRREAFNVMLSMPPGTDRAAVTDAGRAFAREEFGDQRDYVFAAHDDEAHPHVHIVVLARGYDGRRLNPRKADLQRWRERFARELRDRGVEANATPRRTRGVTQQYELHLATLLAWRAIASVLAESPQVDDRILAKGIAEFVRTMSVVAGRRNSKRRGDALKASQGMEGQLLTLSALAKKSDLER